MHRRELLPFCYPVVEPYTVPMEYHWTLQVPVSITSVVVATLKFWNGMMRQHQVKTLWTVSIDFPENLWKTIEKFGGRFMVCSGDFRHVLPIFIRKSRDDIVANTIKRCCWCRVSGVAGYDYNDVYIDIMVHVCTLLLSAITIHVIGGILSSPTASWAHWKFLRW